MRRPFVAGNWKMNGSRAVARALAAEVAQTKFSADVLLCPPACYLAEVGTALAGTAVALGAQDCSEFEAGPYTGETAAAMLADLGCTHCIVGHSERRQHFGDSDSRVLAKLLRAQAHGLTPILCVGESSSERRAGTTEAVVARQLDVVLERADATAVLARSIVAYEPVWAIGTGESASPAQAQAVHAFIRARVAAVDRDSAAGLRILYGGSVKADNAAELFHMPDIDGGLVGGAALTAASFIAVCQAAA